MGSDGIVVRSSVNSILGCLNSRETRRKKESFDRIDEIGNGFGGRRDAVESRKREFVPSILPILFILSKTVWSSSPRLVRSAARDKIHGSRAASVPVVVDQSVEEANSRMEIRR